MNTQTYKLHREVTMYVVGGKKVLCTISLCLETIAELFFAKKHYLAETSSCVWNGAHAKKEHVCSRVDGCT